MAKSKRTNKSAAPHEDQIIRSTIPIPEDIAVDILLTLPPKPLFRFKCVSKQCESLVSNPEFGRMYMKQSNTSAPFHVSKGMLYPYVNCSDNPRHDLSMKSSMDCRGLVSNPRVKRMQYNQSVFYLTSNFRRNPNKEETNHEILASSNGLILSLLDYCNSKIELCVSNPLTTQFVRLPSPPCPPGPRWTLGFATRVYNAAAAYKVVLIQDRANSGISDIKLFSSDTGSWSVVPGLIICPKVVFRDSSKAQDFCYKGILHWLDSDTRIIVTYDPYKRPCQFGQIRLPNVELESSEMIMRSMNLIRLGDSDDMVRFCEIERSSDTDRSLLVWRLDDYDNGEWCLEQKCLISPLCRVDSWLSKCSQVVAPGWLNECRQVVAPDPVNRDAFCCLFAKRKRVMAIDLGSGKEEFVNVSKVIIGVPPFFNRIRLVPFAVCPWSSPFYGQKIS